MLGASVKAPENMVPGPNGLMTHMHMHLFIIFVFSLPILDTLQKNNFFAGEGRYIPINTKRLKD